MEKLQAYKSVLGITEDKIEAMIKDVIKQVFMVDMDKS